MNHHHINNLERRMHELRGLILDFQEHLQALRDEQRAALAPRAGRLVPLPVRERAQKRSR